MKKQKLTLDNSELYDLYVVKEMSCGKIAKEFCVHMSSVARRLKKMGVIRPPFRTKEELSGKIIGPWRVIKFGNKSKNANYWICECRGCGHIQWVARTNLKKKNAKGCRKCFDASRLKLFGGLSYTHWHTITGAAAKRSIEVSLTPMQAWELFLSQNKKCAISGILLTMSRFPNERTASLDRIDSSKSYQLGNVWWVHKHINQMKWNYDLNYFIKMCKMIVEHQNEANLFNCD